MELEFKSRLLSPINLDHSITFCTLAQRILPESYLFLASMKDSVSTKWAPGI